MTTSGVLQVAMERVAADAPATVGWIDGTATRTYGELDGAANHLADGLRRRGIGTGDIVALLLARGPDMLVAMLGVLKTGAAYLPLSLDDPPARREHLLRDSAAAAVVVHGATRDLLATDRPVIDLAGVSDTGADETGPAAAGPTASDPAYVIYTSGSTGAPRGVVVEHGNVVPHLNWLARELPLGPGDRLLQVAPYTFDASVTDFWWPMAGGATIVSLPEGDHLDPLAIATALAHHRITAVRLPPALLPLLLDEPVLAEATDLRYLLSGGDRLPAALAQQVIDLLPGVHLLNRYGPTEAAVAVTYHRFDPAVDTSGDVPIGRPLDGVTLHLAGAGGGPEPLAPGRSGELLIGGTPVARGYLGDEAATAERFVDVPGPGRLFRSGDHVEVSDTGDLVFTGRRDRQVQVAGHRVEPGEVEAALADHPGVRAAAVAAAPGGEALQAWVVRGAAPPSAGDLRVHLLERLPRHLVPGVIVLRDELPLTDRGKVDLARLASDLAGDPASEPTATAAAATAVRRAWHEIVGTADTGRGFVASGGTSLQAARLAGRLRSDLGVHLSVGDILRAADVDDLEARVAGLRPDRRHAAPPARPAGAEPPLSHLQERLWFLHEFAPTEPAYNFQAVYRFTGELDEDVLHGTLGGILERHEILRTSFPSRDGIPRQVVHPRAPLALTIVDLRESGLDGEARAQAARAVADDFVRRPFEIDQLPLVRFCLVRVDEQQQWLVHSQHHLIHDGWSFSVFLRELLERYRAGVAGRRPDLPTAFLQCGDFAWEQRRWWEDEGAAAHLPYWREHLRGVPPLALPTLPTLGPDDASLAGSQVRRRLEPELVAAVTDTARRLGVTPFMACFAVWGAFLWTLTGQRDFAVGTAFVNRPWREAEHMLGCVLNNIAVRMAPAPTLTFGDLAVETGRRLTDGYTHGAAPLHAVVGALQVARNLDNPLFQTTFNFHDAPFPDLALPGVKLELEEGVPNGTSKFPLDVIVLTEAQRRTEGTGPEEWDVVWNASLRHFTPEQSAAAADAFVGLLARVCAEPGVRLAELAPLDGRPSTPAAADEEPAAAAAGPVAEVVRAVWRELLGVPDLADDGNFFEHGGHSLLAVRAISQIRSRLGQALPVRLIFEAQTVRSLADAIASGEGVSA